MEMIQLRRFPTDANVKCHSLLACAGVFLERKILTEDGFEQTWAVNVLAPFLLTSLLVKSVKERIINVSSISAGSRVDFGNLNQVGNNGFQHFKHNQANLFISSAYSLMNVTVAQVYHIRKVDHAKGLLVDAVRLLDQEKGFSAHNAYSLSKLAMMMFNTELATRLSSPPTANCLDPGTVNTKMLLQGMIFPVFSSPHLAINICNV